MINSDQEEYISIYDLIEWAKTKHYKSIVAATFDIFTILQEQNQTVEVYQRYTGIKERITKKNQTLNKIVLDINKNQGYQTDDGFDDTIPF